MTTRTGRILAAAAGLALCAGAALGGQRHHGSGHGVSIDDGDDPRICADLSIRLGDREAARAEDRTTLPASSGPLRLEAARNSGIHVRESDRADFQVVLCKAAPDAALLSAIAFEKSGEWLTVRGPQDEDWVGYLLVEAPRGASLDLRAYNGPIGLSGLSGRVVAETRNGPISVRDSGGDLDLNAKNGPIHFQGAGGKLKLRTQNGPIGVALTGDAWQGEGLEAEAINGPVSLRIPEGYRTAALVESRGRSPFACSGDACRTAKRTWDDDHRRIEIGDGPALVRLSTENGPVSVRAGGRSGAGSDDEDEDEE